MVINYNKLHADPQQGKSLDIVLKKMKHRLVENMSSSTADALGLSRYKKTFLISLFFVAPQIVVVSDKFAPYRLSPFLYMHWLIY